MSTLKDESSKITTNPILFDIKLVQEVRKWPALYDPRRRGYKDSTETEKAWTQVANELGLQSLDVRNRWRSLRDKFVREKKRLVLDGEASYRSRDPWPLLDEMSFLWDFIYHRKDVYTRKMSAKVRAEYIQRNQQPIIPRTAEWLFETPEASPSHVTQLTGNNETRLISRHDKELESARIKQDPDDGEDTTVEGESSQTRLKYLFDSSMNQDESSEDVPKFSSNNDDTKYQLINQGEDELFCLSVASTLRRFSPQKKALAKLRIQEVLYEVEFIQQTSNKDARAIRAAQEVFKDDEMEGKLAYIKTNFGSLPSAIDRLQERGIALANSLALVKDVQEKLDSVVDDIGKKVSMKIRSVLDKNPGYKTVCTIVKVLSGESFKTAQIQGKLTPSDLSLFRYAPVVSAEVERSFSMYNNVLADNRQSFSFKNLRMYTVIY
ncbi:hypothetical protein C0J52_16064 [Blattella germanica]|nr:hypothetical protein C0J52_16064 [Blattella germanica]